jgi:hypothetical protein
VEMPLPDRLDTEELSGFFRQLDRLSDVDEVVISFEPLRYSFPAGMLIVGSKLRQWIARRKEIGLVTRHRGISANNRVHSYLMHLGFFDFIGLAIGREMGEAAGSSRYLPIRKIHRNDLDSAQLFDSINDEARDLAGVMAGSFDDSESLRTYRYCIREILRNVFEHSGADECFICGQRWQNGNVEFAILDEGVGICATLGEKYKLENDAEALQTAIRPGTSRTVGLSKEQNVFDNSGFGLFVLSQLSMNFGWFCLGSGAARLFGKARKVTQQDGYSIAGTFFGARFLNTPSNFTDVLSDIIASGEEEAKVTGVAHRASGKTRVVG